MSQGGSAGEALVLFHPVVRRWFQQTYTAPTDIQLRSWPVIASGRHVLLTAPTGSGKTLCAFLWAINQLVTGTWSSKSTRVLYVSPLKALNNDIRRNLVRPLREIREHFALEAITCPDIRIFTRSGDTPPRERQQMLRRPPEILITTPESLNLLLSSPRARENLREIQTVILDEIHAIAANKRGTHLITAVERLVGLSGEFQRLALSATVKPVEGIAHWIGGYQLVRTSDSSPTGGERVYRKREVVVLQAVDSLTAAGWHEADGSTAAERHEADRSTAPYKQIELKVHAAAGWHEADGRTAAERHEADRSTAETATQSTSAREAFWNDLVAEIKSRIRVNRSTLIFTNTRRHAEKLARLINEQENVQLAYAHHGSLSKEIRLVVERKLKAGELSAIVATSSLELGIDIGALDEVLLVQTPFSVASTLQRIGRAGHGVGEVSRGRLYCTHGRDLLNAALMARSIVDQDIEEIHPIEAPLDLLAQIILSMTAVQTWQVDDLFGILRTSSPFHDLPRKHFDLVLEMLAGRYADQYLRELKARVSWDRLENTVRARRGALPLIYRSGGTIPDRGYYDLRLQHNAAKIGELDEEFVWERKVGDTFNLGTQNWKIVRIDSKNVEVIPWSGPINITPFWRAEKAGRDFHFTEKLGMFLEEWNDRLQRTEEIKDVLISRYSLDEVSAEGLIAFLKRQRAATDCDLPHRHHLLVEQVEGPLAQVSFGRVILHTLWGSRVNYPFSLILEAAWRKNHPKSGIEALADDDCVLIIPSDPDGFSVDELLSFVQPAAVQALLQESLEGSGFFGARFRENAGRALLLPRSNLDRRIPLWLTRMRAKKLLESVAGYGEFPILLETWRSCLQDEFDLPSLKIVLGELSRGQIRRSEVRTTVPSPFAANISWIQTNQHMYQGDGVTSSGVSAIQSEVIREVLYSTQLRPRIAPELVEQLRSKLQRTAPDYAPAPGQELLDWVKERLLIEDSEWDGLCEAVRRDYDLEEETEQHLIEKLVRYRLPGAEAWVVSAIEQMPRILRAVGFGSGRNLDELIGMVEVDGERFSQDSLGRIREFAVTGSSAEGEEQQHLSAMLAEWLRFYGPVPLHWISRCFGLTPSRLETVLDALVENGTVIVDQLTREATLPQVCDAENLEILLRLTRKGAQVPFTALSLDYLSLFLAVQQGLIGRQGLRQGGGPKDLRPVLESLFGYPAPVRLWEEEIFPTRLKTYQGSWLDQLLQSSELQWCGCDGRRIAFCFSSDLELFLESEDTDQSRDLAGLLPSLRGKFSFWDLVEHSGFPPSDTTRTIWELVWKGKLAADSFDVLRKAAAGGFRIPLESTGGARMKPRSGRRSGGRSYDRWRSSHPLSGSWFGIGVEGEPDALEEQELARDRVRQLLQRYGILFRELLARELPPLQWSRLFRTLRIMELSGEILSGYFFEGIQGLQFISQRAFRVLQRGLPEEVIYWICAADPASPCGLGLPIAGLPARLASTHLVFHGSRLGVVSKRRGAELELQVSPEHPSLPRYLRLFDDLLSRDSGSRKSIRVEQINGSPSRESPYKRVFLEHGFVEEYRGLILRAGY
ncbi:MAG: DEAD/DEAH box helicase [Spirochaetaceae bacterium]|nr:MAG: DEAD/DEAH box helicase [Spirochaetaceae bacterium]